MAKRCAQIPADERAISNVRLSILSFLCQCYSDAIKVSTLHVDAAVSPCGEVPSLREAFVSRALEDVPVPDLAIADTTQFTPVHQLNFRLDDFSEASA